MGFRFGDKMLSTLIFSLAPCPTTFSYLKGEWQGPHGGCGPPGLLPRGGPRRVGCSGSLSSQPVNLPDVNLSKFVYCGCQVVSRVTLDPFYLDLTENWLWGGGCWRYHPYIGCCRCRLILCYLYHPTKNHFISRVSVLGTILNKNRMNFLVFF